MFDKSIVKEEGRRYAVLLLTCGLIQVAGYYLAASVVNGPGPLAVPQPDTLLYCQAARRICEGHAFSFSAGTAVSTGTTSVLYPFVLAGAYAMGFKGLSLLTAGFLINALFYGLFLYGWMAAFNRWFKRETALFASILLVLFPQFPYCACAQSDTGLWMAVSGLIAAGFATHRVWLYAPLLLISPWVRPEGALLIASFLFFSLLRKRRFDSIIGGCGLISVLLVLLFNRYLTGLSGFSSVAKKGYFVLMPFASAVEAMVSDFLLILRDVFLGQATGSPRFLYAIPVLGPVALIIGFATRKWEMERDISSVGVLLLTACFGVLVVAQSGWQGSNVDRYLAWMMPLFIGFSAAGWRWAYERLSRFPARRLTLFLPIAFYMCGAGYVIFVFNRACDKTDRVCKFAQAIDQYANPKASVGTVGLCGIAYCLEDRRLAHLSGIYSPEFAVNKLSGIIEVLKHEPATRFDYWMLDPSNPLPEVLNKKIGETELIGPDGFTLARADWKMFDAAAKVPNCEGHKLVDRVDVGYDKDEKRANYEQVLNYGMNPFKALVYSETCAGIRMVDVGRLIAGYDEMSVSNLTPGHDLLVKMRTIDRVDAISESSFGKIITSKYAFNKEVQFHASVDGVEVSCCHVHITTNGFSDVTFKIPGAAITSTSHRIGLHGDHATFGYWFYQ